MRHNTHLIQWANGRKIKTIYFAVYRHWHTSTIGLWRNRLTKTIPPYLSIFHVCLYLNYNLFGFLLVSFSNRFTFLVSACVCVCMHVFYLVLFFPFGIFFFLLFAAVVVCVTTAFADSFNCSKRIKKCRIRCTNIRELIHISSCGFHCLQQTYVHGL